jgi:hypothetical protein
MRKSPSNFERLEAAVRTLGKLTVDEIVDRLRKLGIKGVPKCSNTCLLARYFTRRGVRRVNVQHGYAKVDERLVPLPYSASYVIAHFDDGYYPRSD